MRARPGSSPTCAATVDHLRGNVRRPETGAEEPESAAVAGYLSVAARESLGLVAYDIELLTAATEAGLSTSSPGKKP
jgi:hypothetical protein